MSEPDDSNCHPLGNSSGRNLIKDQSIQDPRGIHIQGQNYQQNNISPDSRAYHTDNKQSNSELNSADFVGSRKEVWRANSIIPQKDWADLEALKKTDFGQYYEGAKLDEWKDYYLDYKNLKMNIESMYLDLFNFFKSRSKPGKPVHLPKNHEKVTEGFKKFEEALLNDLRKVSSFYHEEEVKVLSLTYDLMNQLKMITVTDFSKVLLILKQMESCTRELMDIVFYIKLNTSALKHLLKKFDDTFQAFHNPILKDFFKRKFNEPDSPVKILQEHPGTLRCYFQQSYIKKIMDIELEKIYNAYNVCKENDVEEDDIALHQNDQEDNDSFDGEQKDIEEKRNIRLMTIRNLYRVKQSGQLIDSILMVKTDFFFDHKHNLWKSLGINVENYYNEEKMEEQAAEIFRDEFVTKDDFIHIDYENFHIGEDEASKAPKEKPCYSMVDLWFVIIHTFLFMTNYYAQSPTAYDYIEELGYAKSLTGAVSAATPLTETAMAFQYNWLTNKTYKWCLVIGWVCCAIANLSYGCAYSANSLTLLILGRIFLGAGGARIVTRKFVALMVCESSRTTYSAIFVALTALGKTGGPGLSAVFQYIPAFDLGGLKIRYFNAFSFIAFIYWTVFGLVVLCFFEDIQKQVKKMENKVKMKSMMFSRMGEFSKLNTNQIEVLLHYKMQVKGDIEFRNSGIDFRKSMINIDEIRKAVDIDYDSDDSMDENDSEEDFTPIVNGVPDKQRYNDIEFKENPKFDFEIKISDKNQDEENPNIPEKNVEEDSMKEIKVAFKKDESNSLKPENDIKANHLLNRADSNIKKSCIKNVGFGNSRSISNVSISKLPDKHEYEYKKSLINFKSKGDESKKNEEYERKLGKTPDLNNQQIMSKTYLENSRKASNSQQNNLHRKLSFKQIMRKASDIYKDDELNPPPLKVYFPNKITTFTFLCFLFCKAVQESFFYEIPQVMKAYYGWNSQDVGFTICAASVFAIPIAQSIAPLSKKVEDRAILFWSLVQYLIGILLKVNYQGSTPMPLGLYLTGSGILFVGSLVSETAAISILSKVISPASSAGILNAGFVSGLGDTGGRSLGNIMVAVCGAIVGVDLLDTLMYGIYAVIIFVFLVLTWVLYDECQKLVYVQIITNETEKQVKNLVVAERKKKATEFNKSQQVVGTFSLIRYNEKLQKRLSKKDSIEKKNLVNSLYGSEFEHNSDGTYSPNNQTQQQQYNYNKKAEILNAHLGLEVIKEEKVKKSGFYSKENTLTDRDFVEGSSNFISVGPGVKTDQFKSGFSKPMAGDDDDYPNDE